ncbi:hypothetical protein ZEAMMB73_Zm00001d023725 [Zea mays]|uniref:Uncharacterized protein n=1 Tax=Zea mays TaxID=4577 RepID=A0A1D6IV71_MAIZE|nr:hypothetical protein ZEAMMB73_Zm00001d023725 [Zea mays]
MTIQIGEVLQMQIEVQRKLNEQLEAVITEINENIGTTGVVSQECKAIVSQCGQQILDLLLAEHSSKRQPFRSYEIKIFSGPKPMKGSSSEIELRRVDYFSSKELPQVLERIMRKKLCFLSYCICFWPVLFFYHYFRKSLEVDYFSSFTMKLLEEGFDLCAHLLALRRYNFMEISD